MVKTTRKSDLHGSAIFNVIVYSDDARLFDSGTNFKDRQEYDKSRSHHRILRIRFLVPKIESRRSDGPISRFRFCGENVGR